MFRFLCWTPGRYKHRQIYFIFSDVSLVDFVVEIRFEGGILGIKIKSFLYGYEVIT